VCTEKATRNGACYPLSGITATNENLCRERKARTSTVSSSRLNIYQRNQSLVGNPGRRPKAPECPVKPDLSSPLMCAFAPRLFNDESFLLNNPQSQKRIRLPLSKNGLVRNLSNDLLSLKETQEVWSSRETTPNKTNQSSGKSFPGLYLLERFHCMIPDTFIQALFASFLICLSCRDGLSIPGYSVSTTTNHAI
jgi:hypothetical protein